MKLLVREPGRLVYQLRARDRNSLRGILRLGSQLRRRPPRFTRGPIGFVPPDSDEMLRETALQQQQDSRESALGWLEDPARCVAGKGGFGLTLTEAEAETMLQALNHAKMAFWEALGCPDENAPFHPAISPEIETLQQAKEIANAYIAWWVDSLSGDDPNA